MNGHWICAVLLSTLIVNCVISVEEGRIYHGTIREDAADKQEVDLDLPLFVRERKGLTGDDICGYTVYKSNSVPIPFQVILLDRKTGSAKIVLTRGNYLNYELTKNYEFQIAADDCVTGAHSVRDVVHIDVEDVNEFSPIWKDQTYIAEVIEGQLFEQILKLEALDGDGSEIYSKICHYHLLTKDVPFEINSQTGFLQNTEPLDYNIKHNYILEVQAEDCGKRLSDRLLVNILVKPECRIGWKGIEKQIEYAAKSGRQSLGHNVTLETCGATCQITQLSVSVKLHHPDTEDADNCDIDSGSIEARNRICGLHPDTVSLLTSSKPDSNSVFSFDGKSVAYEVTSEVFDGHFGSKFTISTWLRHKRQSADAEETKQHILCNADGEGMSRHHFSLFLHNCRLILLLRKEPGANVDLNIFQPAEWRWKLSEVCDDKWHHYTINMEFPEIRLFVDGRLFIKSKHNEDVIDDWPLHMSKKAHTTKLFIGGCWEGNDGHLGQFLNGQIAELTVVNNDTESDQVIGCVNSCREKIDFHAISEMETGMSISMNSAMTELDINGQTKESVENLVSKIGYINPRLKLMTEITLLTIDTSVKCASGGNLSVASSSVEISFVEEQLPKITLGASTHLTRQDHEIVRGEKIFKDLLILVQPFVDEVKENEEEIEMSAGVVGDVKKQHLDSCIVRIIPSLDLEDEHLTYPENLVKQLRLKTDVTNDGIVITGFAKVGDYVDILRNVLYIHKKIEDLNSRSFRLSCSEDHGRVTSNELDVELDIIHTDHRQQQPVDHAGVDKLYHSVSNFKSDNNAKPAAAATKQDDKSSGIGIAAIVVICVGFLIFIVVLGVLRIRSVHQRSVEVNVEEKQEMEWDNSALTITVNPMDSETVYEESETNGLHVAEETDTDDDIGSFHDDRADSSEEEEQGQVKDHDLEWDSTTATY